MLPNDPIKEAFSKVKEDISQLSAKLTILTQQILELKRTFNQTDTPDRQTDRRISQTVPHEIRGFKPQNFTISTGNDGVQTDRQTHRQTDTELLKFAQPIKNTLLNIEEHQIFTQIKEDPIINIQKASQIIASLDSIKKDLRFQFKKLTSQEMLVFSVIYQLTDDGLEPNYSILANKTNLSESSIRDYVQKLIKKGIPLQKTKQDNKQITLSIPPNFKKIASLSTINSLRNL